MKCQVNSYHAFALVFTYNLRSPGSEQRLCVWTYNFIGLPITLALEDNQTFLQFTLLTTAVHPELSLLGLLPVIVKAR